MHSSKNLLYPPIHKRIISVWYRHYKVYTRNLISNGLPPFLEPLIFLAGLGLGMSKYISEMGGIPYITFLATGLPITAAMFTAAFECSYGTFIRLEFDRVYDGMLASPLNVWDLMIGEIFWAGTKGLFFSFAVILVVASFGAVPLPSSLLAPIIGFLAGLMFAAVSLLVTSFVSSINQFNFYFTGFLSPMFFFSGVVFPLENLPGVMRAVAEIFPLTHVVRLARSVELWHYSNVLWLDLLFVIVFTVVTGYIGISRLHRKMVT